MIPAHVELAWKAEPGLIDLLLLACLLYWLATGPLRRYLAPQEERFPRAQALWFYAGLLGFYLAVQSPLDELGEEYLFSAHMVQHVVLMYPVPLLIMLGLPSWLVRPLVSMEWSASLARFATHPVVALVLVNGVFAAWHFPGPYEWALRSRLVHDLEHLSFMATAFLMWWPFFSPLPEFPRLSWGGQMVYAFFLAVAQTPVFGFVTFSPEVLYPTYEAAPRLLALTPLEDQRLGGVVMKISSVIVFGALLIRAFFRWYAQEEGASADRAAPAPPGGPPR